MRKKLYNKNMIKSDIVSILDKYPVIALAVSGGSDSMAMLEWFRQNRPTGSFVVLNIDHHIRGEESKRDSDFVCDYANRYGIKLYHYDVDAINFANKNKYTLEQAARILRHNIYEQATSEYADVVATAHHMSDQVESIFMHIARGCGVNGLVGMSVENGHIIHPLIRTTKAEILAFIKANKLEYCEDSTNKDDEYSRNFTRNQILPRIREKYASFDSSLIRLAERAREIVDFIDINTPTLYLEDGGVYCDFEGKHNVIKAEMIRRAFSLLGVNYDIENKHIEIILDFYKNSKTHIDMPYDTIVYKEKNGIVISKKCEYLSDTYRFSEGFFEIGGYELQVCKVSDFEKDVEDSVYKNLYIAIDSLSNLEIRLRQNGDIIEKFGGGRKSLGDFMTDKKVPLRLRDRLPVIASGNEIICVCGVDISVKAKVDKRSTQVYKLKLTSLN